MDFLQQITVLLATILYLIHRSECTGTLRPVTLKLSGNDTLYCIYIDNLVPFGSSFCNDEKIESWSPRITEKQGWIACGVPTLVAWLFTLATLCMVRVKTKVALKKEIQETSRSFICGVIEPSETYARIKSKITIQLVLYLKLLWDAVDVTLDSYLFYQLEMGEVLDKRIYRNQHVNNAILGFACLGALKILAWFFYPLYEKHLVWGVNQDDVREGLKTWKFYMTTMVFFLEDGPELILEYFFIEKYVNTRPPWYLLARDAVTGLIAIYLIVDALSYWKKAKYLTVYVCCIGVMMLLRVAGAGLQFYELDIHKSCFKEEDLKIYQTPFVKDCLRQIDFVLIGVGALLCCILVILIAQTVHYHKRKRSST